MKDDFTHRFAFSAKNHLCLGQEEEVWTVSPDTGLLVPAALQVFGGKNRYTRLKPELPAQQIEMITPICRDLASLNRALGRNERLIQQVALRYGFEVCRDPVPVLPFSINVFPTERYRKIQAQQGERLRGAYVAGLHTHIGLAEKEQAVQVMNVCRLHLPGLLALSARSPVFAGQETGYASYRYVQYKTMAGEVVPPYIEDWDHFTAIARDRGFHEDPRMCWWAIRISPHGTVELRVTDLQEDRAKTVAIAAVFLGLVKLAVDNDGYDPPKTEPEQIESWLMDAAKGRFDAREYLESILGFFAQVGLHQELKFARSLL